MNPTNILSLVSDLYGQIAALAQQNEQLNAQLRHAQEEAVKHECPANDQDGNAAP